LGPPGSTLEQISQRGNSAPVGPIGHAARQVYRDKRHIDGTCRTCTQGCRWKRQPQLHGPRCVELGMVERRVRAVGSTPGSGATLPSIASRRSMRSCVFGCVENRLAAPRPDRGLMMNRCAVAGLDSAALFGICAAPLEILASAEASDRGRPLIAAPMRSASYSREREMANCTSMAASGA